MNDARFAREQRRGQNRQRRIFRAADLDRTRERMAAVNQNLIHTWQKEIVLYLNNRFSNKCRGNFFPPRSKEAPRSDRARSPGPAFHPGEGAPVLAQSMRAPTRRRAPRQKALLPGRAKPRVKDYVDLAPRCREGSRR